jgi:ATP-dependent exoDNAse (exonuclease V) beta subunit
MISDAAARSAALDPRRSFIVQAPAGSGKTELLAQRYLRLLATVESPEQILAITFTRKAAAEMRARILQSLQSADAPAPESVHKRSTWELARAVRAVDAQRAWQLMQHPARLRIQTIDALNASLARRLPVIAGTGAALEPTTDVAPLFELAGRRLLERLGDGSEVSAHLEVLVMHLGNRVERLIQLLNDLLAKRDQWLHIVMHARASTDLRATLQATLTRLVENHLQLLCEGLGKDRCEVLLQLRRYSARNLLNEDRIAPATRAVLEVCAAHPSPLLPVASALPVWREIASMLFKKDRNKDELYESVSARQGFPTTNRDLKSRMLDMLRVLGSDQRLLEDLATLRTLPDPVYSDEQWRVLEALLELLPAAVAELQVVFQMQGKADYVEIALRALRALGTPEEPTDLALAFDYRLQHILVDEFQDTSFSQLDLLERLTGGWADGDGRTLFCVGDPMQSIYRFRQAEVGLFIDLQQHGLRTLRLTPLRLEANFRSVPTIVDWINESFPAVLAARNDAEQGAVQYSPSTATVADSDGGGVQVHRFVNADEDIEAARVVSIVRETLESSAEGSIAILVAARTHVDAIARELAAADVDFQAIEIEQLRDRPVVQDLMALTRALVHVADRTAWLAVLRAPWCGLTLADLHALAGQPAVTIEEAIPRALGSTHDDLFAEGRLSDDGRARLERTWQILGAALAERGRWPLRIWVERTWNALGGPATLMRVDDLDDAEAYLARLAQIEVAADLDDVARLEEQLFRLFANARFAGAARVEVMTIHAAKGLEFDTVIVPGLQRYLPNYNRELMRWARVAGPQGGMVLAPVKPEGGDPDPIYRWIEILERRRVARERARLLYVAVTRAKRELHLLGNATAKERDGRLVLDEPRRGSMLRMLWGALETTFWDTEPSAQVPAGYKPAPPQKLRRLPLEWRPPRTQLVTPGAAADVVDIEDERPVFDWVSQVSRHVGTLVHRELDRLCRPDGPPAPAALGPARPRLMAELAELGVPPDRCEAACERVISAMERTLADERGRWLLGIDGRIRNAASELAISGVFDGQILEGVIDRTFLDESGQRWVVDFKTSTHEGGGLDAFLDEEVVRYRPQLARYAHLMRALRPDEPIRAALYFPMLKAWREVPLGN